MEDGPPPERPSQSPRLNTISIGKTQMPAEMPAKENNTSKTSSTASNQEYTQPHITSTRLFFFASSPPSGKDILNQISTRSNDRQISVCVNASQKITIFQIRVIATDGKFLPQRKHMSENGPEKAKREQRHGKGKKKSKRNITKSRHSKNRRKAKPTILVTVPLVVPTPVCLMTKGSPSLEVP